MIGFIKGIIEDISSDSIIVDNQGIGWVIHVPQNLLDGSVQMGDEVKLYTYMQVSENAMGLYGFFSRDDLQVFKMLLNVSGIGPKGAVAILGTLTADNLRFAVLADDAAAIAKAPGIGKKTAQKIVLELKDKFKLDDAFEKRLANNSLETELPAGQTNAGAETDAVQALVALGYSGTEALQAVRKVHADPDMDSEAILKAALKNIF